MANEKIPYKIYLEENELPKEWYNVRVAMTEGGGTAQGRSVWLRQQTQKRADDIRPYGTLRGRT